MTVGSGNPASFRFQATTSPLPRLQYSQRPTTTASMPLPLPPICGAEQYLSRAHLQELFDGLFLPEFPAFASLHTYIPSKITCRPRIRLRLVSPLW